MDWLHSEMSVQETDSSVRLLKHGEQMLNHYYSLQRAAHGLILSGKSAHPINDCIIWDVLIFRN